MPCRPPGMLQERHRYYYARVAYSSMMPISLFEDDTRHVMIERRLPFGGIRKIAMGIAFSNGGVIWNLYLRLKNGVPQIWRNTRFGMEIA